MLAINDQIVSGSGVEVQPQVVRVGIPNIHAPIVLAGIYAKERPCKTRISVAGSLRPFAWFDT